MSAPRLSLAYPRLWRPNTVPTFPVEIGQAPRGLDLSLVPGSPSRFTDLVRGANPVITSIPGLGISAQGPGLVTNGSGVLGYFYSSAPAAFSMEALVQTGPAVAANEAICSWNKSPDGSGGDHDRTLFTDGASHYKGNVFPGGDVLTTTAAYVNNVVSHLVYTSDGTTANLYLNGKLDGTGGGGAFTGYGSTSYFVVGFDAGLPYWSGKILLVNLATVAWTGAEIAQRAAEPFAMLRPVVQRQYYAATAVVPPAGDEMLFHAVF